MKYQGHFYLARNCRACNETQWKEQRSVQYEEITSYSFAEYISDLGGAAGLVLGWGFYFKVHSIFYIYDAELTK